MNKFNRFFDRGIVLFLLVLLLSFSLFACDNDSIPSDTNPPVTTQAPDSYTQEDLDRVLSLVDYSKLSQVEDIFNALYVGEFKSYNEIKDEVDEFIFENVLLDKVLTVDDATTVFLDSYLHIMGDKYAYYYDASAYEDVDSDMKGEYVGIGIQVTLNEDKYIDVMSVFKDGPADKVGILPGDILVAVNGEDVIDIGYYETIDKVKGEIGTSVELTFMRDGEKLVFNPVRDKVIEISVEYEMKDESVGYIHINGFNDKTYGQFVEAYKAVVASGAKGIVFDVRNNPGGSLESVLAILEFILPDGPIVHLEYKNSEMNQTFESVRDYNPLFYWTDNYYEGHQIILPMVVLTNRYTASAGELFTSSLKDYGVAKIIGEKTYGKGVGQTGLSLFGKDGKRDGSVVMVTYFYYAPPYSENYDGVGIFPDIEVMLPEEAQGKSLYKLSDEEDTQLKAGIEEINRILNVFNIK